MYFQRKEHLPMPYWEEGASYNIGNGEIIEDYLPKRAEGLVKEWIDYMKMERKSTRTLYNI